MSNQPSPSPWANPPLDYAIEDNLVAPPANKVLAFAVTLVLVALPMLFFGFLLK